MQTKQQERAKFALEKISDLKGENGVDKDLATYIVGMPNMILSNGIAQTLAFLLSKANGDKSDKKSKYCNVFKILKEWICKENLVKDTAFKDSDIEFLKKFNGLSSSEYLKVQDETLRLVEWLKRYARAFQAEEKKE